MKGEESFRLPCVERKGGKQTGHCDTVNGNGEVQTGVYSTSQFVGKVGKVTCVCLCLHNRSLEGCPRIWGCSFSWDGNWGVWET